MRSVTLPQVSGTCCKTIPRLPWRLGWLGQNAPVGAGGSAGWPGPHAGGVAGDLGHTLPQDVPRRDARGAQPMPV